jgi:UTP:GlnB (protein PII) uridylyltransferase
MQLDANGDEYGTLDPVSVTLDNATTSAYSLVNIVAADRKGLFYDLMRTLKDIHLRVAYAKVPPPGAGTAAVAWPWAASPHVT